MTPPTLEEVEDAIEKKLDGLFEQLSEEFETVLNEAEARVDVWIAAVVSGDLSLDEFRDLVEGEKEILELEVLHKTVSAKALTNTIKNFVLEQLVAAVEGVLEKKAL